MKPIDLDETPNMAIVGALITFLIPICGPIIDYAMFKTKCQATMIMKNITGVVALAAHLSLIIYIIAE